MVAPISDLYERYKIGTKRVVQWLAENGGKSAANDTVITLSTNEITALAESILEAASPDQARPKEMESIISILEDVIAGRRECAAWYKHSTIAEERGEKFDRCQKGHQHFIDVLRIVLGRLKQAFEIGLDKLSKAAKRKKKTKAATSSANTNDMARNVFAGLGVEEPSMEFLAAAAADLELREADTASTAFNSSKSSKKSKKKKKSRPPVFVLETQAEDGDFALWCLLKDCYQIRLYVCSIWHDYTNGKTSLAVAASISDKAFSLVQRAVQIFIADYPALSTIEQVADHVNVDMSVKGKKIESFRCKGSSEAKLEVKAAELLCATAYLHLMIARQTYESTPQEDLGVAPLDMSSEQEWDRKILYQVNAHPLARNALEFLIDASSRPEDFQNFLALAGADRFTFDLGHTFGAKSIPLHTVIEYQIYMDIVAMTDKIADAHFKALMATKEPLQQRIRDFERLSSLMAKVTSLRKLTATFEESQIREQCRAIMAEGLENYANVKRDFDPGLSAITMVFEYPWVVKFPVFGGTLTNRLITSLYRDGLSVCDKDCFVLSVAHLYRACRSSGILKKSWKDMDLFISVTPPGHLKLPSAAWSSSALINSARHYATALGAVAESRGHETNPKLTTESNHRAQLPSYEQIEQRRIHLYPVQSSLYGHSSEKGFFKLPTQSEKVSSRDPSLHMAETVAKRPEDSINKLVQDHLETCGKLTPTELLKALKAEAESQEVLMLFDHHGLMLRCWRVLDAIQQRTDLALYRKLPNDFSVMQLTDEILWEAAEVGTTRIRQGLPTGLGAVAWTIESQLTQVEEARNCNFPQKFRDSVLRYNRTRPVAKRAASTPRMPMAGAMPTEQSSFSISGRQVAFDAGVLSAEDEAELRSRQERCLRMEARVAADEQKGVSMVESMKAFEAEYMAELGRRG